MTIYIITYDEINAIINFNFDNKKGTDIYSPSCEISKLTFETAEDHASLDPFNLNRF